MSINMVCDENPFAGVQGKIELMVLRPFVINRTISNEKYLQIDDYSYKYVIRPEIKRETC